MGLGLGLALAAAEVWARLQERSVRLVSDGRLYTEWPGEHGTNADGFLERELPRRSARRRIAVLGDSMTWGTGTAEQTWTRLAEQELGEGWEVLNFATYGYDTAQERATLPIALKFQPEFVVVAAYTNDVLPTRLVDLGGRPVFVGEGRAPLALLRLWQGARAARVEPEEDWAFFRDNLRGIVDEAGQVAVVVVGLRPHTLTHGIRGCNKELGEGAWCRDQARIADRMRIEARGLGLPFIDLSQSLYDTDATAFWPPGGADREHPNPEGAAAVARAFAAEWKARYDRPVIGR